MISLKMTRWQETKGPNGLKIILLSEKEKKQMLNYKYFKYQLIYCIWAIIYKIQTVSLDPHFVFLFKMTYNLQI